MEYICDGDSCMLVDNTKTESSKNSYVLNLPMPSEDIEYTVYGTTWCPFCIKAKKLLRTIPDIKSVYINIEKYTTVTNFKQQMAEMTNDYKTIPIIFNKTEFIGGYTDLCKLLESKNVIDKKEIKKIVIHPIKNGKEILDIPAKVVLQFKNGPTVEYNHINQLSEKKTIECDPFTINKNDDEVVTVKIYAFDRTEESGRYFTLYPSRLPPGNTEAINIYIRINGPFIAFSLAID